MCGQFNYDITDDFKVPNGGEQATIQNFANAYGDSTCQTGVYSYNLEMEVCIYKNHITLPKFIIKLDVEIAPIVTSKD